MDISYANSMWFSNDININEDFRTRVMAYYDAEITELNFTKPSSFEYINNWGSMKTNGQFDHLIKFAPPPSSNIFIINALSLNTSWKQPEISFTTVREFYGNNDKKVNINTINWNGLNVKLNENEDYSFLEIPFENDQFMLSLVHTTQNGILNDFMESFTFDELNYLADNSTAYKANISLPEIQFSSDKSIKSTLSNIGLNELFLSTTDLTPSFLDRRSQISEINHLSKITLDKNPVNHQAEASFINPCLKTFLVDKPFVYFVHDKITNTVLFTGYYSNPLD